MSESIDIKALNGLRDALESLIPDSLLTTVSVVPTRIKPAGIGGFVSPSENPIGERIGRQIDAEVRIALQADDAETLHTSELALHNALLGGERKDRIALGILHIRHCAERWSPPTEDNGFVQQFGFELLYEFVDTITPTEGGIIDSIPVDFTLSQGQIPKVAFNRVFESNPLELFDVIDDPMAKTGGPSDWVFNEENQCIEQHSKIRGGPAIAVNPKKPGTYLVLKESSAGNFVLRASMKSSRKGGVGLVFNWQNHRNFSYFLMDNKLGVRIFGKKKDNVFQDLEIPSVDVSQSYDKNEYYDFKLVVQDARAEFFLNNSQMLSGADPDLNQPGRVGLFCRNNHGAAFYKFGLVLLN